MRATQDIHVRDIEPLIAPGAMKAQLPMSEAANATVVSGRQAVNDILTGEDPRFLVVVGPCSIHDPEAALEYAQRLAQLRVALQDRIAIVMRVYFEKPRTTVGWKGLINDPHLDGTFDLAGGLRLARELLLAVAELGMPAGTEMLDPITPQYTADLVTWASIGARTTESQTHRQMASGLSMPVGFKNGTDGNLQVALDAMEAARHPHSFLGIANDGRTCVVHTSGNPSGHLILRGGYSGPNYDAAHVAEAGAQLGTRGLPANLMVDCSHANSGKDHRRQGSVLRDVLTQRAEGNRCLIGAMLESNLHPGRQNLGEDGLARGVSITDACIGWEETEALLHHVYAMLEAPGQAATV